MQDLKKRDFFSGSFTKPSSGNMGGRPQVSSGFSSNMNRSNFQRSRQQDSDDKEGKYYSSPLNLSWGHVA